MSKLIAVIKVLMKYLPVILAAWAAYQQIRKVTAKPAPPAPAPSSG